ncbi:MAG TPA: hypothetical protein VD997_09305 [Phycisphaerales bacterium]|nr:hypothetical protein [Phycisphaerales bacterium]
MPFPNWQARASIAVTALVLSGQSHAQWSVAYLNPANRASVASGVSSGGQVGLSTGIPSDAAVLWNGSAQSWVNLNPSGAGRSKANAAFGSQQAGSANYGGWDRATIWHGTAASAQDIHPVWASLSEVMATSGVQQAGYALVPSTGRYHATVWSGSSASAVDLHPGPLNEASFAWGVAGGQQVGSTTNFNGNLRQAALWSGTAGSYINLTPSSYYSEALAVEGGIQVGYERATSGSFRRPVIWSGTAASMSYLAGPSVEGAIRAIHQGRLAGEMHVGAHRHATMWNSATSSPEDLATVLTGSWAETIATGIWSDGQTIFVTGYGFNTTRNRNEALLWTRPVPTPATSLVAAAGLMLHGGRRRRSQRLS